MGSLMVINYLNYGLLIIFSASGFPVIIKFQSATCKTYLPSLQVHFKKIGPQCVLVWDFIQI